MESSFANFDTKEFQSIKGYEWLVQNHEKYQTEIVDHYLKLECSHDIYQLYIASFLLLDSAMSHLSEVFQTIVPPLDLLPVDLLCSCVSLSLQLQNLPYTVIAGLKWMEDLILGHKSAHKEEIQRYCSSNCLELLRAACEPYSIYFFASNMQCL